MKVPTISFGLIPCCLVSNNYSNDSSEVDMVAPSTVNQVAERGGGITTFWEVSYEVIIEPLGSLVVDVKAMFLCPDVSPNWETERQWLCWAEASKELPSNTGRYTERSPRRA